MKKSILIIMVCTVLLTGCNKQERSYKDANIAYENGDYETAISAFKALGDYKDSQDLLHNTICASISQQIEAMGDSISDESQILNLIDVCEDMGYEEFSTIENADTFETLLYEFIEHQNMSLNIDASLDILRKINFLSDSCIEKCLLSCGRWGCIDSAECYIKESLKSPRSYYRNSSAVSAPRASDEDDYYTVTVSLDYDAANSFGGEVRNKGDFLVRFTPDFANKTIEYACAGNTLDILANALNKIG